MSKSKNGIPTATFHTPFQQSYFHGTKADLKLGDLVEIGFASNFGERKAKYVYLAATLDPAVWGG